MENRFDHAAITVIAGGSARVAINVEAGLFIDAEKGLRDQVSATIPSATPACIALAVYNQFA